MNWTAESPSNIALIKYMGKADKNSDGINIENPIHSLTEHLSKTDKEILHFKNQSWNPSISYTLNHFLSKVCIKESSTDNYSPFDKNPFTSKKHYNCSKDFSYEKHISTTAQQKFLDFFQFLKRVFLIPGHYTVFSQNNFPIAVGTASSASSFSALSQATYKLALDRSPLIDRLKNLTKKELAYFSRVGSGSSGRSFFSPWCFWDKQNIKNFDSPWESLDHQLIIVDAQAKKIHSTKAHEMVKTSPHFKKRSDRVNQRINTLQKAFQLKSWEKCFKIFYEEFLDMHSLFETADPPFQYKTSDTKKILDYINNFWEENKDGPWMTMDAGANVHLLYRPEQKELKEQIKNHFSDYIVLSSL